MGSKKKMAQAARRAAREVYKEKSQEFAQEITNRLSIFNKCLKKRPSWFPRRLWRWLVNRFIDLDGVEDFIKSLQPKNTVKPNAAIPQSKEHRI